MTIERDLAAVRLAIQDDWHVDSMGWEPAMAALSRIEAALHRAQAAFPDEEVQRLIEQRDALKAECRKQALHHIEVVSRLESERDFLETENEEYRRSHAAWARDELRNLREGRDALRAALEGIASADFINNSASDIARQALEEVKR